MGLETNTFDIQESKLQLNNPDLREIYSRIMSLIDWKEDTRLKTSKADSKFDKELGDIQKDLGKLVSKDAGIALLPEFQAISKMIEDLKDDRKLLKDFYKEVKAEQKRLKEYVTPEEFCKSQNVEIAGIKNPRINTLPENMVPPLLDFKRENGFLHVGYKKVQIPLDNLGKIHPQEMWKLLLNNDMIHPWLICGSYNLPKAFIKDNFYLTILNDQEVLKVKQLVLDFVALRSSVALPYQNQFSEKQHQNSMILQQYCSGIVAGDIKLQFNYGADGSSIINLTTNDDKKVGFISNAFHHGEIYLDETFRKNNSLEKKD